MICPTAFNTQVVDLPECLPTPEINVDSLYQGASGLLKLQVLPLNWRGQANSLPFTYKQGEKLYSPCVASSPVLQSETPVEMMMSKQLIIFHEVIARIYRMFLDRLSAV